MLGICIWLNKLTADDPQFLFRVPLQKQAQTVCIHKVCQQRMTTLHIGVEIGTAF